LYPEIIFNPLEITVSKKFHNINNHKQTTMKKIITLFKHAFLVCVLLFAFSAMAQRSVNTYSDSWGKQGFTLLKSDNASVQVNFSISEFALNTKNINGENLQNIELSGCFLPNDEGAPDLPGNGRYIAIPQGAVATCKILASRTETFHNVNMAPAFKIPWDNDKSPLKYAKSSKYFSKGALYPEKFVQISEPTQLRGVDVVMLGITPFQYNPVTKDLIVYRDLKVEVSYKGGNGHFGDDRLRSRWFDPILQDAILNQESLPTIDYGKRATEMAGQKEAGCEYLIIVPTNPEFAQWADSIKEFRTLQGINTQIKTLTEVGGNTSTAIKNYITNAFNTWTIPPVAVLLLGDYGSSATNSITSPMWDNYCVSDNIYSDVNNDMMPDIVFSRITANNASQLQVMVSKGLNYERNPPTSADYYHHPITALGWQTERWFQLCSEIVGGFWHNVLGKDQVRINAVYQGNPASDPWSTASNTNDVVSYFGPSGLGYIPATPQGLGGFSGGTPAQVVTAINNGAFILQHRDHGYEDGWGEPGFSSSNINQLTNTDLTFVYSINCLTGKYNYSPACFGENFHRYTKNGNNSGALGFVAPSEVSYSFVNDTYTWGMYDNLWPNFMPAYGTTPASRGMLPAFGMAAGKYFLNQSNWPYNTENKEVTYYLFHAHCDAFLNLYSEIPQNLTVQYDPIILSGLTSFEVTANEGAFIALTANGEILGTATATGAPVTVTFPAQLPGTNVEITITKENYYRFHHTIQVIPPTGAYVIKDTYAVNDTILGNGNGQLDYGENVNLSLGMKNVGSENATNVVVTISSADSYVTLSDSTETFGNIPANGSLYIANAFAFTVANNVPDNHSILFNISTTDGTNTWTGTMTVTAHAPILQVGTMTVSDPTGNNNGRLDPGETADIIITTTNTGSSTAANTLATLASTSGYVTINSGTFTLGNVVPGTPVTATFNISVDPTAPIGSAVELNYTATSGQYSAAQVFTTKIGLVVEDFESNGFTHFAWTQGGNQPWTITNVDPYEGVYSAKSGAIGNSQKSQLSLVMDVAVADSISFYLKTSSESSWDYLKFYVDATMINKWSGETPWTRVAFPVTAGNHTFKWEYMKDGSGVSGSDCSWIDFIVFPATQIPQLPNVSGIITYANTANTPLNGLTVNLKNASGTIVGTSTTNATGAYNFSNVPAGSYTLEVSTNKIWGGVTASDVLLYRKHIANVSLLNGIYLTSGDVNVSSSLTAADVLLIRKRIASVINSFPSSDWLFNNTPITVSTSNVVQNFNGIVYGDANGSYIPTETKSTLAQQGLMNLGTVDATKGDVVVPIHVSDIQNMGSFQFTVQYDATKLQLADVTDWFAGINDVTIGSPAPGYITFVWAADVNGINISDDVLCNIHFTSNSVDGSALSFVSNPTKIEFSDYEGNLFTPEFVNGSVGSITGIGELSQNGLNIYPNPSNGKFTLTFNSEKESVNIKIVNTLGKVVFEENNVTISGNLSKTIDLSKQPKGIYMLYADDNQKVIIQKIVIEK